MSACTLWAGRIMSNGYGRAGKSALAHRVAYEQANGPIPEGLEIDHLCGVRSCVNPDHLEAVTHAENVRRVEQRMQFCKKGLHPWELANWYIRPDGRKQCRPCARDLEKKRVRVR